jgi:hypothetical protein
VNNTSAAVNGVPSDQVTPSRSLSVKVLLSGEIVQLSAMPGSTSWVARLTLINLLLVRIV